jgi:hypothetical protein
MDSGVARVVVLANGESTYHGRTSALFEDNAQERPVEQEVQPRMPDHWVERGLIAEAAKQRGYFTYTCSFSFGKAVYETNVLCVR